MEHSRKSNNFVGFYDFWLLQELVLSIDRLDKFDWQSMRHSVQI